MSAPTEPGSDEELQYLFRTAAEGFEPDRHRLTLGGAAMGRRMRRRRAAAVLGGAATVAALAVGGTFALAPAARTTVAVAPAASAKAGLTVNEMTAAVSAHLPGLRVNRAESATLPVAGQKTREVRLTVDDGRGPGFLILAVNRFTPPVPATGKFGCPLSNVPGPTDECTLTTLPDGSSLRLGKTSPPGGDPHHTWTATLLTPAGLYVNVDETNMANAEDQSVTRPDPVVSVDGLREIATDPVWQRAFAALPPEPAATAGGGGSPSAVGGVTPLPYLRIVAIATPLLPPGLTAGSASGGPGQAAVGITGGGRAGLLSIQVQDRSAGDDFDSATTLPDGSRILVVTEEHIPGGVRNTVDVLRPDGRRIRLQAATSVNRADAAGMVKPVLTVDELRAIATSPAWKADATG